MRIERRQITRAIEDAVRRVPASGDDLVDRAAADVAVRHALGATALPIGFTTPYVTMPIEVPDRLRYAVPVIVAPRSETAKALEKLRLRTASSNPEQRRGGLLTLSGWINRTEAAEILGRAAIADPDVMARAIAALGLAVRGPSFARGALASSSEIMWRVMPRLVPCADTATSPDRDGAEISLLAAAVAAHYSERPADWATFIELADCVRLCLGLSETAALLLRQPPPDDRARPA